MKAIYKRPDLYCIMVEEDGDGVILEPVDGTRDDQFWVSYSDPNLIIDPTDTQVNAVLNQ